MEAFSIVFAVFSQEEVGRFHPIFLHFPIVLFTAALVSDLLNYFGKSRAFSAGHWFVITGVVMCIPTIITGLAAAANFDPNDEIVSKHRFLGYSTGIAGSFYAGLRISAMQWRLPLKPYHYVGLSVLLVALVSWTSDYGGLITRGETPFNTLKRKFWIRSAVPSMAPKRSTDEMRALPVQSHDAIAYHPVSLQGNPFIAQLEIFRRGDLMQHQSTVYNHLA